MSFSITMLGSGSDGNALLIKKEEDGFLLDAGFSRKELFNRLNSAGISPEVIKAIIVTHEHDDHIKGVRVIADTLDVTTYASEMTVKYMAGRNLIGKKRKAFATAATFDLCGFNISSFRISHDALEPVGFVISLGSFKIGYAMDLGYLDPVTLRRLKGCDVIILESNHDIEMVKKSDRPLNLKRRILGRTGHLDNGAAISALDEIITSQTKYLIFGHISQECNSPKLVKDLALRKLSALNREDIFFQVMEQDFSLPTLNFTSHMKK